MKIDLARIERLVESINDEIDFHIAARQNSNAGLTRKADHRYIIKQLEQALTPLSNILDRIEND